MKFSLRFAPRKINQNHFWIYGYLRINGIPAKSAIATGISCPKTEWDYDKKRIKGRGDVVKEKNEELDAIEAKLRYIYNRQIDEGKAVSAEIVKTIYLGRADLFPVTILGAYRKFMAHHSLSIAKGTKKKWESQCRSLERYFKACKRNDFELVEINAAWGLEYYGFHVKAGHGLTHAKRAVKAVQQILDYCVLNNVLSGNPLKSLKLKGSPEKEVEFLYKEEVELLEQCNYFDDRLQKVVDCFLLQCHTGMAYNELLAFKKAKHLKSDIKGRAWIMIRRGKTEELSKIPLLAGARRILEKYNYCPPVITNQKMNQYIKEAAQIAGIDNPERITTHVGRSTAGTLLLNAGVDIKVVSKILGHKSVQVTERHYAVLLTDTIFEKVQHLT